MKIPRQNTYACRSCHQFTVIVDVDSGRTPDNIKCTKMLGGIRSCHGFAESCGYPREIDERLGPPTHEWYKPSVIEYNGLDRRTKYYVDLGGLLLRERTNKEPIYHDGI